MTVSGEPGPVQHGPRGGAAGAFFRDRVAGRAAIATAIVRIAAGVVFVLFAIPKFAFHDMELAEFVRYGFPASSTVIYLVGVLETAGGLMLVLGLATRLAAAGLAVNMAGAVATAGVRVGGPIHLGLAPTLLFAMLYLLWAGPGAAALDRRLAVRFEPAAR
jgi:putative oxidoreductase